MTDRADDPPAGGTTPERWQAIKRVFDSALERPAGERLAYVASACGADTPLRREVESLLHMHEESGGFLNAPAVHLAGASEVQPSVLSPGQALGRYRVLGLLGAGGMGQVYLAEDPALGRKAALKLLPRSVSADPDRLRRFRDEARAASALSHPNVCVVYEVGETDDGRPYIAMEHVQGESLRQRLERHRTAGTRVPLGEALDIVQQAAAGLHAAHAAGVVHRDVKPENVMVRPDGLVKVLDFGLAKLGAGEAPARDGDRSVQTEPGMVLGTVRYMSPEQARGLAVDARTDVWSLGVVLYELVAGHAPFDGDTASDVLVAVLEHEPAPLATLAPGVPADLERVVTAALQKPRQARYASAAEMQASIREAAAALAKAPAASGSRAGTRAGGRGAWVARRRRAMIAVAAATVAAAGGTWAARRGDLAAGAAGASPGATAVDQRYVVAVLPFESVSADTSKAYFAAGMTEEITGHLSRLSALRVLSRGAIAPYREASDRLPRMAKELGVGSVVEGSVRVSRDRALIAARLIDARSGQTIWTEQYDRELVDVFAVQAQVARSITEALHASLTPAEARRAGRPPTVNLAAYELFLQSRRGSHGSTASYEEAIRLLRRAIALDSTFARAYADLAQAFMFLGFARGPAYFDSGAVAAREAVRIDPTLAAGYYALGNNLGEGGKLAASRTSLLKALSLDPNYAVAMTDLSVTEDDLGRYDESLHWATRALPLMPGVSVAQYHVALPLLRLGDDAAAERFLLGAERRFPTNVRLQLQLATLDLLRGQGEAAIARIRRLAARVPDDSEAQSYLAELAVMTRAADAEALIGPLARDGPEARPDLMPESFRTLHAWTLARRGEGARADSLWTAALAVARRDLAAGNERPDRAMEIAAISAARGDTAAALEWLERGYQAGFRAHRLLARDPLFDGVRAHPRFRQVVQRMQADVAVMRRHAAAAHDTLFRPGPTS